MCGIVGALPACGRSEMTRALEIIAHRGPDGFGQWHCDNGQVSFGHRRLAILDLSESANQPMHYGDLTITFNGEIYNFIELKEELIKDGFVFNTSSDTELVLAAFQKWGENCVEKFNGMWAFSIWNKREKSLFLSRDRFGQKPLYYINEPSGFWFASEMQGLFPFIKNRRISKDFFWCRNNVYTYEGTDKCLIDTIKRFPPGHSAFYNPQTKKLKLTRYWNTLDNLVEVPEKYEDQVDQFRSIFKDACKVRMRSDVPIGTALSGGVDSSVVAGAMHSVQKSENIRTAENWQKAFVASFPGSHLDESYYAQKVIDHLNLDGHLFEIKKSADFSLVEKYIGKFGDLATTSPVPMVNLYKKVKENGVTVTLDGHGADEALSGYVDALFYSFLDKPFNYKFQKDTYKIQSEIYELKKEATFFNVYKDYGKFLAKRGGGHIINWANKLPGVNERLKVPYKLTLPQKKLGFFNSHLYELFHETILPSLLRNYDRYSMIAGVESRQPFMDYRVVSFLFSLPIESKIRNGFTKSIVRDAFAEDLPKEVIYRKSKIGFSTPVSEWMKTIWKEELLEIAHSKQLEQCELVDGVELKKSLVNILQGNAVSFNNATQIWQKLEPFLWEKSVLKA